MKSLVENDDAEICPITSYTLYEKDYNGNFVEYQGNLVKIDNVTHQMEIRTNYYGGAVLWAKTITLGNVVSYVPIEVEFCGAEKILENPTKPLRYVAKFKQFTGLANI